MLFQKLLSDTRWANRDISTPWMIGLVTFGILILELTVIRWTSSQMRIFAYFNNVVLIGAFFGMGVGVALGKRLPGLVHLALPALLVLAIPLGFAEKLDLVHMTFPDNSIMLWGGDVISSNLAIFTKHLAIFLGLTCVIISVFVCCGAPLGYLFSRLPVLKAYSADLTGSLLGVLLFTVVAWCNAGPSIWLALACVPFVFLVRTRTALLFSIAIVALGYYSVQGALFSPYNRIVLSHNGDALFEELQVNRDFHQYLHNLSDKRLSDPSLTAEQLRNHRQFRELYDLPFQANLNKGTALIVGAGTGNDVQAALRNDYREVTSVDIDGLIIDIGRARHPEHPYGDSRVIPIVDDARAFFEKNRDKKYDVVCYGLLDSHAMVSAMSTLRLDNYVYTEEGIRAAWNRVGEGGHLSLAISCMAGQWFFDRLYWTITKATGREPFAVCSSIHAAVTFVVPRDGAKLDMAILGRGPRGFPESKRDVSITTSDDWPFLYIRPGVFPWGYAVVLGFILLLAAMVVRPVFGIGKRGAVFDRPIFLMGAAFMLIETRGITSMSLLFGSTWIVNAAIFSGILLMVLLANSLVMETRWTNPLPWFVALFLAVALLWFFPVGWLQTLPLLAKGLLAGLITGLPVGLAGVIVPMLLSRAENPAASLGANLLGAVLGGCLEYYSMLGGLRSTALMALVLYLLAFVILRRQDAGGVAKDPLNG
ncbi:MAG: hypothetical protein WC378_06945 [Opitutaceae bacterium]|jgi:hypothetical protein